MNTREQALKVLQDVLTGGAFANLRLKELPSSIPQDGVRFISALTYEALEHVLYLDHIIHAYTNGKRQKAVIKNILRLGITELLYFSTPSHAVVSEYVNLVKKSGSAPVSGFVNAILRRVDRERDALPPLPDELTARLSIAYSYPQFLIKMWLEQYGKGTTEQLLHTPPLATCIRPQYPETADTLKAALSIPYTAGKQDCNAFHLEGAFEPAANPLFQNGRLTIQGEAAMMACRAVGDPHNLKILDACSAPGGKSAYLYSLSEGTAALTCWEMHEHRAALIQETFSRLHVTGQIECRDATVPVPSLTEQFDAVLLDVPCSGLGLLAGKPDLRYHITKDQIETLLPVQQQLLDTCCNYVRKGGILVYSTCTINRQENEDQVARFLSTHPGFSPCSLPYSDQFEKQFLPHLDGTEGFYVARLQRCI